MNLVFYLDDDFVNAFSLLLKKGKHLNIYNIETNEQIKIKELAKTIGKILSKKIKIKGKIAKGSMFERCSNISKIIKLGFSRKFDLKNGLKKTINWYQKKGV